MSTEGGGGSQSAMAQCWDLHGDDRTRTPHVHVWGSSTIAVAAPAAPAPAPAPAKPLAASTEPGRGNERGGSSSPVAASREALGRLVHEIRLAHNGELDRPFGLEPWERRSPRQQELDMRIGEAVAAAERERAGEAPPLSLGYASLSPEAQRDLGERLRVALANPGPAVWLPSEHWKERAEAAEAKLDAIEARCAGRRLVVVADILAITGTGEGAGHE